MIKKGTWIELEEVVLNPEDRAVNIPEDTRKAPLKVWIRGFAERDCEMYEETSVKTLSGRILTGLVVAVRPPYTHGFGNYVEEISYIGPQAREILWGNGGELNE